MLARIIGASASALQLACQVPLRQNKEPGRNQGTSQADLGLDLSLSDWAFPIRCIRSYCLPLRDIRTRLTPIKCGEWAAESGGHRREGPQGELGREQRRWVRGEIGECGGCGECGERGERGERSEKGKGKGKGKRGAHETFSSPSSTTKSLHVNNGS